VSETTQAVIEKVTSKEGATNGRAWRKYSVKAGTDFYSTFDKAVAEQAHALTGKTAVITWEPSGSEGQYRDIIAAAPVNGFDGTDIPTERDENGNADWDLIGLRKTRCLLWAHFIDSPMAAAIAAGAGDKPPAYRVHDFGAALVALAESDIYHRPPASAEEALPF
jgi:hypothetical protein